ncbi:A/G-specific adenine glycosylase [Actinomyces sp. B33]|nr:A/G-specific adenine glycosylase [Actinomyces sp. B33]MDC4233458.1 A/G-specific adenine glycosylase [Actinomyces sp. B33]
MRRPDVAPWATLVFEVMSQQTPIPRVQPVWERWMRLWPEPADLAAASPADVLVEWGRLGYPSRALRLRDCAIAIAARPGGRVPADYEELLALPGIGPYTASALASFQFHARLPVLDTNVRRVLARVLDGAQFAPKSAPTRTETARAAALLPVDGADAARWNVAVMEFGALVCTQRSPSCDGCVLRGRCAWATAGFPEAPTRPRGQAWAGTDRQARGRVLAALRGLHEENRASSVPPARPSEEKGRSASPPSQSSEAASATGLSRVPGPAAGQPIGLSREEALRAATLPDADPAQAPRVLASLVADGLVAEDPAGLITLPGRSDAPGERG